MEIANFFLSLLPQFSDGTKTAIFSTYLVYEITLLVMAIIGTIKFEENPNENFFQAMCRVAADGREVNRFQLTYWLSGISIFLLLCGLINVVYALFFFSAIGWVQGFIYRSRIQKYENEQIEKHRQLRAEIDE